MVMASASNGKKKKKNAKKSAKRKPVNLQSNFHRKCKSDAGVTATVTAYESISADMFPANHHHHHHSDDDDHGHSHNDNNSGDAAGDCSCGDFHLHRCATTSVYILTALCLCVLTNVSSLYLSLY